MSALFTLEPAGAGGPHGEDASAADGGEPSGIEALFRRISSRPGDFRILERLVVAEGETGEGGPDVGVGCALDVETMGLAPDDPVIELAIRRFRYDAKGVITRIDRPYSWRQDPGAPIPPEVTRLTGLRDADIEGRMIDGDEVRRILSPVGYVVAHNAAFDRPRVESLFADLHLPWACSMLEIGWADRGFEGCRLSSLLNGVGKWHDAHRAAADVDAVIALLAHRFDDGGTALAELLHRARQPSWIIRAVGAHFDMKDMLKARGYRWDASLKVWWTECYRAERDREEWWLAANVYDVAARPRTMGPTFEERDWTVRHG